MNGSLRSALALTLASALGVQVAAESPQVVSSDWTAVMQLKAGTPISVRVTGRTGAPRTVVAVDEHTLTVSNGSVVEQLSQDDVQEVAYDVRRHGSARGIVMGAAIGFVAGCLIVLSKQDSRSGWLLPAFILSPVAGGALGSMEGSHIERVVLYRRAPSS